MEWKSGRARMGAAGRRPRRMKWAQHLHGSSTTPAARPAAPQALDAQGAEAGLGHLFDATTDVLTRASPSQIYTSR